MKKSCLGVLIVVFLFCGLFFALRAPGLLSPNGSRAKNSWAMKSKQAKSQRVDVGSLPGALRSVLSQTLGANNPKYRVTRSDSGYRAVNARNRLKATMGRDGFTVREGSDEWGLRLTAWGAGRCLKKIEAGRAVSRSNRVDIDSNGIAEWWVNGPVGIEQGWTVANRPHQAKNRGQLTLVLRQSGNLRTRVLSHGRSLSLWSNTGREVLRYTGLAAYDKTGRQLPAHFEVTKRVVRVVVDDKSAAYPVRIDPWVQAAKLTASDSAQGDSLGYRVAVSSDGATVVAGAEDATVGGYPGQGAVYVFKEPPSGWANGSETAKLTASDGAAVDGLGSSVAVSADGTTVVAGAWDATVGENFEQGAVYVFKEPPSGWANGTETAKLTASDGAAVDGLGWSTAVSSDGTTVVAGPLQATVGSNPAQGAVYVFKEPPSGWANGTETAKLTASDGAAHDQLGFSVAVNSDGASVVAGAVGSTVGSNDRQGAVYVFKEPPSGWANGNETAKLTASDGAADDSLGYSVAVSADGASVVAGADYSNVGQGALYVFKEPPSGWAKGTETAKLTASDGASSGGLGRSLAVNSDGATVVAGAPYEQVGSNTTQGAVYVFKEPASGWANRTETAKLTASDGAAGNVFGWSVAVSSDGATVVAGAPLGGNTGQGAVYVFQPGSLWQNATPTGGGWYYLSPFGAFNTNASPWIYHQTLGWLYPFGTSTDSIWFYDPQWDGTGGWWWTGSSLFPWIYSATESEWLYYDAKDSTLSSRWFFTSGGQASTH